MIEDVMAWAGARDAGPIAWLRERLGLSESELRVVWVLVAHELVPELRARLRAMNTEEVADATLDALRRAVYGDDVSPRAWRELGPGGALRRLGLIERTDAGDAPEQRQTFKVARRVLALVHGEEGLDPQVAEIATLDAPRVDLRVLEIDPDAVRRARAAVRVGGLVVASGRIGAGRRSLLCALAAEAGARVLVVDGAALPADRAVVRVLARECALLGCAPLVVGLDAAPIEVLDDLLALPLVLATAARVPGRRWARPPSIVEIPALTGAARARLWRRALPDASDGDADLLASVYPLAPAWVAAAGAVAVQRCATDGASQMQPLHVEAGIRAVLDDRLAGLATRIDVTQSWDDLVLPDDQLTALVELLARIRERRRVYEEWGFAEKVGRGLGVSALFSGPPGTGKTMAAGLVARDLGVELYQVDLARMSSKWIGETEKNLAALFDAAEAGCAILLFDEADALFGKRTEVRTSNDRHANHETNYLLQRMESFAGICILTTNHEPAIDEAFRRRLSVHVRFAVPELDERRRLWRALLPAAAPVARDLPLDALAGGFAMSGGYIRNAVLRAAFLAADARTPITGALLARAAQLEYEAMGKIPTSVRNVVA